MDRQEIQTIESRFVLGDFTFFIFELAIHRTNLVPCHYTKVTVIYFELKQPK